MKWYQKILPWLSFIGGMILMFFMRRPEIGDKVTVNQKIKNKKSTVTGNELTTQFNIEPTEKKERFIKRIFTKKKRNGIFNE